MKKTVPVSTPPKTAPAAPFFQPRPGMQPETEETGGDPFFGPAILPKLMVGAADSPAEKEADRMADQVVQRLAEPAPLQRAPEKEEEKVQRQAQKEEEKVQRQAGEEEPSQAKTTTPLKKSGFEFMLAGSDAQKFLDGLILALPKQSSAGGTEPKTPQAPERVSLWTRNNFSIGLRLSLPTSDLTLDPKYILGGAEIRQARFKSAVENWTGNVPTGLDAIDLGQGFKVSWSIFATHLAPDLASGLSSAVSSQPNGGTEFNLQLDFFPILEGGLTGGGLSFRVVGDWDRYVFGKLFSGSRKETKTGAGAPLRRKTEQEDEPVQAKHADSAAPASLTTTLQSSKGGGQPLPGTLRTPIENAFGADFGSVRIHTGAEAAHMNQSLHAQAFTHGRDIYFNEGKYRPETTEGKHLLAHELGHVAQEGGDNTRGGDLPIALNRRKNEGSSFGVNLYKEVFKTDSFTANGVTLTLRFFKVKNKANFESVIKNLNLLYGPGTYGEMYKYKWDYRAKPYPDFFALYPYKGSIDKPLSGFADRIFLNIPIGPEDVSYAKEHIYVSTGYKSRSEDAIKEFKDESISIANHWLHGSEWGMDLFLDEPYWRTSKAGVAKTMQIILECTFAFAQLVPQLRQVVSVMKVPIRNILGWAEDVFQKAEEERKDNLKNKIKSDFYDTLSKKTHEIEHSTDIFTTVLVKSEQLGLKTNDKKEELLWDSIINNVPFDKDKTYLIALKTKKSLTKRYKGEMSY